jgi:probable lipoprotein NlpC
LPVVYKIVQKDFENRELSAIFIIQSMLKVRTIVSCIALIAIMTSCKSGKNTATSDPEANEKSKKEKSGKKAPADNKKAEAIIKEARSYAGTPYKYGGTTRAGIDCSALTCASYKAAEISLPRTAGDQSNFGKKVSLTELKKGDLVFFTDKKGNTKITHVGMITEVKGPESAKFIHASTKAGVVEVELFSTYYKPLIVKAVRVL